MVNPKAAKRLLLELMKEVGGSTTDLAAEQDVSASTVKRWISRLEGKGHPVRKQIERMRAAAAKEAARAAE